MLANKMSDTMFVYPFSKVRPLLVVCCSCMFDFCRTRLVSGNDPCGVVIVSRHRHPTQQTYPHWVFPCFQNMHFKIVHCHTKCPPGLIFPGTFMNVVCCYRCWRIGYEIADHDLGYSNYCFLLPQNMHPYSSSS